ncbi:MAG: hypothetical protein FD180_307 [Planctomycetota bacterium]|nr:MAG: hypothetical protein FD180_307 [Planctomycetota bacterium]
MQGDGENLKSPSIERVGRISAMSALAIVAAAGPMLNYGLAAWFGDLGVLSAWAWIVAGLATYLFQAIVGVLWPRLAPATALAAAAGSFALLLLQGFANLFPYADASWLISVPLVLPGILGAMAGRRSSGLRDDARQVDRGTPRRRRHSGRKGFSTTTPS